MYMHVATCLMLELGQCPATGSYLPEVGFGVMGNASASYTPQVGVRVVDDVQLHVATYPRFGVGRATGS